MPSLKIPLLAGAVLVGAVLAARPFETDNGHPRNRADGASADAPATPRPARRTGGTSRTVDAVVAKSGSAGRPIRNEAGARPFDSRDEFSKGSSVHWLWIAGRVLDDAGEPIPATEVTATPIRLFGRAGQGAVVSDGGEYHVFTDDRGDYTFHRLVDGDYEVVALAGAPAGEARAVVRAGVDTVDLVVNEEPQVWVHGVVRGARGEPLADAMVLRTGSMGYATRTDASGRFGLHLPYDSTWPTHTLLFVVTGYEEQRLTFAAGESGPIALDVRMTLQMATGTVTGTVVSRRGTPVSGQLVHLYSARTRHRYRATTDGDGRFSIPSVGVGETYRLRILPRSAYRDHYSQDLPMTTRSLNVRVVLEPLEVGRVTGRFVDVRGVPVPGFSLLLHSRSAGQAERQVTSDGRGRFSVQDIPAGQLVFESRSLPRFLIHGPTLMGRGELQMPVVLDWGDYQISGRVVDSQGNPLPVRDIVLTWNHHEGGITSLSERGTSADAEGYFRFSRLGAGHHTVKIDAPGFATAVRDYEVGARWDELNVRLEARRVRS